MRVGLIQEVTIWEKIGVAVILFYRTLRLVLVSVMFSNCNEHTLDKSAVYGEHLVILVHLV